MKQILYIFLGVLFLSACEKDEKHKFDKSPDERLQEQVSTYMNALSGNENGWLLVVDTKVAGGFSHWVGFNKENRVQMLSDIEVYDDRYANSAVNKQESSYTVKALQNIVLSFDTYNYLHILTDPEGKVNGGKNGVGLTSDFEFVFLGEKNGMYNLKGRYNKVQAMLMPCSPEEYTALNNGGLKSTQDKLDKLRSGMKFPAIEYKGVKANFDFSPRNVVVEYINENDENTELKSGAYIDFKSALGNNLTGNINLFEPLDYKGGKITSVICEGDQLFAFINNEKIPVFDNKKSVLPLRLGYGKDFAFLRVDPARMEGTLTDPYLTDIFIYSRDFFEKVNKGFVLQYLHTGFIMSGGVPVFQLSMVYKYGKSLYSLLWHYDYVMNEDGTISFTNRRHFNAGATRFESMLRRIADYFCTVTYKVYNAYDPSKIVINQVIPRTFKIDWADNNTEGLTEKIGGLYPVHDPDYILPGIKDPDFPIQGILMK